MIHAHIYSAGFTAILMKMIFRIPVVLSEHSSDFMRATPRRPNMLKARLALQKANIVLPVSRHLMESIKHYRLGRSFRVVPNAVNTELFHPPEDGVEPGKKKILFIGLLKPLKGISYLLDAIGILAGKRHDFVLDIVGDGPGRKDLER